MTTNPTAPVRAESRVIPRDALEGIRAASKKTGVGFRFLLAEAQRESAFQSDARHTVTSASGLFQFTSHTWLDLMKGHGAKHGMGDLAAKIGSDGKGNPTVSDPDARKAILDLRRNGKISAIMAAEFANDNRAFLERKLAHPVSEGDLYLAHFLGPGGAATLLQAGERDPDQSAASLMPEAARHNRPIFFDSATNAPRSVAEVTRLLHNTINRSMLQFAGVDSRLEKSPIPPQRPAIYAAVEETAESIANARSALLKQGDVYTVLARGDMPPKNGDTPPTTETETRVETETSADAMRVAQADYIESRHVYSMSMPPAAEDAAPPPTSPSPAEPRVVAGPGRAETVIDHIFNTIFDRRTIEG